MSRCITRDLTANVQNAAKPTTSSLVVPLYKTRKQKTLANQVSSPARSACLCPKILRTVLLVEAVEYFELEAKYTV